MAAENLQPKGRGDVYALFAEQPQIVQALKRAEVVLREIKAGRARSGAMGDVFANPQIHEILTTPHPSLDDRIPIIVFRSEAKPQEPIVADQKSPRAVDGERESDPQASEDKPTTPVVRYSKIGQELAPDTRVVHLTGQGVLTVAALEEILKKCPHLEAFQVAPTFVRQFPRRFLQEHGLELKVARVIRRDPSLSTHTTQSYEDRKRKFEALAEDPKRWAEFQKMVKYKFREAEIALMYYGDERMSIWEISQRLGRQWSYVQRKLAYFNVWMGISTKSQPMKNGAALLPERLRRAGQTQAEAQEADRYPRQFRVGDKLPPQTLARRHFALWQKIMQRVQDDPSVLSKLQASNVRLYEALVSYYQLHDREGRGENKAQIGRRFGVSPERGRQFVYKALVFLGL